MDLTLVCQQLTDSFAGQMILGVLGLLAGSGTLAQVDACVPERIKNRNGPVLRIFWAVIDGLAGNHHHSKNEEVPSAAANPVDPSVPPPPAG